MKKTLMIFIGIALICGSCETVIEVDLPEQEPKLVVFGFLNPHDDTLQINVRSSNPVFGKNDQNNWFPLYDATVVIRSSTASYNVPWNETYYSFLLDADSLPIINGETYYLEVSHPDFETVYAQTTIPQVASQFVSATVEQDEEVAANMGLNVFNFNFEWQDITSGESFYCISIQQDDGEIWSGEFNDGLRDQEMQSVEISTDNAYQNEFGLVPFRVYLLNATEEYYRYKISLKNITYGDPFSEPSLIFSNVTNGLGCFSSYSGTSIVLEP